jgi:ribonuclease HI
LGGGAPYTTNNKMELTAAIEALAYLQGTPGPVAVYTDSTYVIKGIREWIWAWRRRGWRTAEGKDVLNRDLWERLATLVEDRGKGGLVWHYVRGHVGTPGNERVDEIADAFARNVQVACYRGPIAGYGRAILDVPGDTSVPARSGKTVARAVADRSATVYLSLVDGRLMRHATWTDCERRVKGRSGAKFKKVTNSDDERATLRGWGVDPDSPTHAAGAGLVSDGKPDA